MQDEMFKLIQELSRKIDVLSNEILALKQESSTMKGMIKGFYLCLPVIIGLVCYVYNSDSTRYDNQINNLQQMYFKDKEIV
jgi:hypothetical protein